jgi:hypothetical protein
MAFDAGLLARLLEDTLNARDVELSLQLIHKLKALGVELEFTLETGEPPQMSREAEHQIHQQVDFRMPEDRSWVKEQLVHGKGMTPTAAFQASKNISTWEGACLVLRDRAR